MWVAEVSGFLRKQIVNRKNQSDMIDLVSLLILRLSSSQSAPQPIITKATCINFHLHKQRL